MLPFTVFCWSVREDDPSRFRSCGTLLCSTTPDIQMCIDSVRLPKCELTTSKRLFLFSFSSMAVARLARRSRPSFLERHREANGVRSILQYSSQYGRKANSKKCPTEEKKDDENKKDAKAHPKIHSFRWLLPITGLKWKRFVSSHRIWPLLCWKKGGTRPCNSAD